MLHSHDMYYVLHWTMIQPAGLATTTELSSSFTIQKYTPSSSDCTLRTVRPSVEFSNLIEYNNYTLRLVLLALLYSSEFSE